VSDARLTLALDGRAAADLEGRLAAASYVAPDRRVCAAPSAAVRQEGRPDAEQADQLLFGEVFEVLERQGGFAFGRAVRDGYVGWVDETDLAPPGPAPTHRVAALRTYAFGGPSIKAAVAGLYSLNALVTVEAKEGRLVKIAGGGWMIAAHLAPLGDFETDPVAVAERFLAAPYQWGGRESLGLDCSGLVQQAFYACGRACPRDTDMQKAFFTRDADPAALRRGDLVFWKGHVALMLDGVRILHANGHHMATVIEPLAEAVERIKAAGSGEPTAFKRP
jgi:cell wall-associated NlpC family hydrolase